MLKNKQILVTLFLLLCQVVQVQSKEGDPIEKHIYPPELIMKYQSAIGLTGSQREAIKTLVRDAQSTFTDLQWDLQDIMGALVNALSHDKIEEEKALEQLDKVLALEHQIKRAHLGLAIRIKNTLTTEQKVRLNNIRAESNQP